MIDLSKILMILNPTTLKFRSKTPFSLNKLKTLKKKVLKFKLKLREEWNTKTKINHMGKPSVPLKIVREIFKGKLIC